METTLQRFATAADLPGGWDAAAPSYFQQREFLAFSERYNPCRQRYYTSTGDGEVRAGAIVYTLRLDLLTFLHIPSPIAMNIIGVPIGTATPGFFGAPEACRELLREVARRERGLLLTLNAEPGDDWPLGTRCRLIPTILFENPFTGWDHYLAGLRAPHRRRILALQAAAAALARADSDCSAFTEAHHRLYLQVHGRAKAHLERLTCAFFRELPARFRLSSYYREGRLVSWTITVHDGTMFMYFFGGMDYANRKETGSYLVGLLNIVRAAVEGGHPLTDLGQTAEEPKLRFGGRPAAKVMYLTHPSPLVRRGLEWARPLLEFRGRVPAFRVFRNGPEAP